MITMLIGAVIGGVLGREILRAIYRGARRRRALSLVGRLALPAPACDEPNAERIAAWRAQRNGRPDPTGYSEGGVYWRWDPEFAGWFTDDGRFNPAKPSPEPVLVRPAWARRVPMPLPSDTRLD